MAYTRISKQKTHKDLYGLKDKKLYMKLYARKRRQMLKGETKDSYWKVRQREIERMAVPEPTITVDQDAFGKVIHELERQLKEFPENELLILNLKKQKDG